MGSCDFCLGGWVLRCFVGWACCASVRAARNRRIWDSVVDGVGRFGGQMREGHGFYLALLCFALLVLSISFFLFVLSLAASPVIFTSHCKRHPQPETAALASCDRLPVLGVQFQLFLCDHVHASSCSSFAASLTATVPYCLLGVVAHVG